MSNNTKWAIGLVVGLLVICLCIGVACLTGGLAIWGLNISSRVQSPPQPFEVTREARPHPPVTVPTATNPPLPQQDPAGNEAFETLQTLENEVVPINDPRDLARRLEGKENISETVPSPSQPLQVGDEQTFWVSNVDTNENFQVTAKLGYITDHLYFWIGKGVKYSPADLKKLSETFETKIYPTDRDFFGSEWSPGVDGDPHLYVLYAGGLGSSIAGYFSSADELNPQAHEYSNAHEMFLMNSDNVDLGEEYIYGTMAHEFQHMIHWYRDRNEESWMNEGFSVLAEFLNGYDTGGFDYLYVSNPDLQLTDWPEPPDSTPHYGESFLFLAYFLDRFGDQATQAVVAHEDNGMDSIDAVMKELNITDSQSGKAITADDIFADWVVASYLNNPKVGDGRYAYKRYTSAPQPSETESISDCPTDWQTRAVHQYGVDYIRINCSGSYTLEFEGATEVGVLPAGAYSGDYAFWSNKGDELDMTLSQTFDFSNVTGPFNLNYRTWYDVEKDYDYVYLTASEDGQNWQILTTPSGTDKDPSGNSYGWGYNGDSGGWIEQQVDLSQFAGKKVQLRFEYVTDAAVNGQGFMLDDISIPAIDYSTDFEQDEGNWQGDGFVRIQNRLPQTYRVSLISQGGATTVEPLALDDQQAVRVPVDITGSVDDMVLVVSGDTRFTTQTTKYRFRLVQK